MATFYDTLEFNKYYKLDHNLSKEDFLQKYIIKNQIDYFIEVININGFI